MLKYNNYYIPSEDTVNFSNPFLIHSVILWPFWITRVDMTSVQNVPPLLIYVLFSQYRIFFSSYAIWQNGSDISTNPMVRHPPLINIIYARWFSRMLQQQLLSVDMTDTEVNALIMLYSTYCMFLCLFFSFKRFSSNGKDRVTIPCGLFNFKLDICLKG